MDSFYDGQFNISDDNFSEYDLVEPCHFQNNGSVERVVGPYVHSIICVLGFLGNGLVISTYAFYKRRKSMTDVLLLNVAVADLLLVASLPLLVAAELSWWPLGAAGCRLLRGCYSLSLFSGALLLACVSADRYVAIVMARRSFRLRSLARSRAVCSAAWAAALLLALPSFFFYSWYQPSHLQTIGYNLTTDSAEVEEVQFVCDFRVWEGAAWLKVALRGTQMAAGFFVPLLVMLLCYSAVVATLLRAKTLQRHRAVRLVLAVVAAFIGCHLPYNAALLYDTATMSTPQPCAAADALRTLKTVTRAAAYLHCCLNPVLYAFVGVKFRNRLRRALQDVWCLGKSFVTPQRLSRVTSTNASSTNQSSCTM